MRALVVDDSKAMRSFVGRTLREMGLEVVEAGDGREGLEQLERHPDTGIALVDWHMPEMDGYEFVRQVRQSPAHAKLPILMVTSVSEGDQVVRALQAGASEYIMKPFTPDALVVRLKMMGIEAR